MALRLCKLRGFSGIRSIANVRFSNVRAGSLRSFSSETKEFEIARPFLLHKIEHGPDLNVSISKDEFVGMLRQMIKYRRMEIVADNLYKARDIRGFCHLYDGQEAIITGMRAVMKKEDSCITAYRDHCHQVAFGDTSARVIAELMGKAGGSTKGKGGSMHMYYPPGRFYGGNGIVGAQVPIGAGLALAHKTLKDGGVSLAVYGDGAANQGQIFEAANMAALLKLPVVFVCENNEYGMGTSVKRAAASTAFYTRGDYVPGIWVDGMDVLACKQGFHFAIEWCRSGKGPIFLEANTYRYHGHSMSDPGVSYRAKQEIDEVRATRDCIESVKQRLSSVGWATDADFKVWEKESKKEVEADVEFARASPFPSAGDLWADIVQGPSPPFIRAVEYPSSIKNPSAS